MRFGQLDEGLQTPFIEQHGKDRGFDRAIGNPDLAGDLIARQLEFLRCAFGAKQQGRAKHGQQHAAGFAFEQGFTDNRFQFMNRARDCRLRPEQGFRRPGNAAQLGDGDKGAQMAQTDVRCHREQPDSMRGREQPDAGVFSSMLDSPAFDKPAMPQPK